MSGNDEVEEPTFNPTATSIIVPNRNGARTLARCLDALMASNPPPFEVLVVDDASDDDSRSIAAQFPCRWLPLLTHRGAAAARNEGARQARGQSLFFTDADCYVGPQTVHSAGARLAACGVRTLVGGSYEPAPAGVGFFGTFQSALVNHWETRQAADPDYVATHALMMDAQTFRASGGFDEGGLPILEDIDYSHRMKQAGLQLYMDDRVLVTHGKDYSWRTWLFNAWRKAHYWTIYSLRHGDWAGDTGAASWPLKFNTLSVYACLAGGLAVTAGAGTAPGVACLAIMTANLVLNRRALAAFSRNGSGVFACNAALCYLTLYPLAVGTGAISGVVSESLRRLTH